MHCPLYLGIHRGSSKWFAGWQACAWGATRLGAFIHVGWNRVARKPFCERLFGGVACGYGTLTSTTLERTTPVHRSAKPYLLAMPRSSERLTRTRCFPAGNVVKAATGSVSDS